MAASGGDGWIKKSDAFGKRKGNKKYSHWLVSDTVQLSEAPDGNQLGKYIVIFYQICRTLVKRLLVSYFIFALFTVTVDV